jgi:hypothetical protein
MELHETAWIFFHGAWNCMKQHGIFSCCMELHETAWNRMKKKCSMEKRHQHDDNNNNNNTAMEVRSLHITVFQFDNGDAW